MTIGREGYEWDINTNDGYITLSGDLLIHWGNIPKTNNDDAGHWQSITFSPAFSAKPYFFRATKSAENSHIQEIGYIRTGYMTASSVQFRNMHMSDTCWLAIGPR